MRLFLALALLPTLLASSLGGCASDIPVKPAFGTSALKPTGNIPPEFVEFNNYDPSVNGLLADQICATPYDLQVEKSLTAVPGEMVSASGYCQPHTPILGN